MAKQPLIPPFGEKVKLKNFDPGYSGSVTKEEAQREIEGLEERFAELQEKLYAQNTQSLLVVLQAMDAGGKDGTIKHVFNSVNPQGVRVTSFKQPSSDDLAHDFLWRIHSHAPPKGYIGIFNRSHYEDVLVVRVAKLAPREIWEKRYDQINAFERLLAESGTRILKFFLHISKDEQKERFQARLDDPTKRWKFSSGDIPVREQWDDYMKAYEVAISRCNTEYAPWHIVPANQKWYRNLVVMRAIVKALDEMKVEYPEPEENLDGVVIPD